MFKRIMIGAIVLILLSAFGTIAYAIDDETNPVPNSVDSQESMEKENNIQEESVEIQDETDETKDEISIEINYSLEDNITTSDTTILLSGDVKEGSIITVDVYSVKSVEQVILPSKSESKEESPLTESDVEIGIQLEGDLLEKETTEIKEEYEHQYTKTFEVGELGFFAEELELKEGKYKIAICLQREDKIETIIIRYVTVADVDYEKELENIKNDDPLDRIKKIIPAENSSE